MSLTYRLSDAAFDGLLELADFYDRRRYGLGDDVRLEVLALVRSVTTQPHLYGRIPRCPVGREIRRGLTHRFPVLVVYEVCPTEIVVLAVVHAHAHPRTWQQNLNP